MKARQLGYIGALTILLLNGSFITNTKSCYYNNDKQEHPANYQLIKKDESIMLYSRWIKVTDELYTRQLQAVFTIHSSVQHIVSVIRNEKLASSWIKGAVTFYHIKQTSSDQWYTYTLFKIPWPFESQDIVSRYKLIKPDDESLNILIVSVPDLIPVKQNTSRVIHYEAIWKLVAAGNGITRVEYSVFSNQAPVYPRWITDPIIQNNLINSLSALRNLSEKSQKALAMAK